MAGNVRNASLNYDAGGKSKGNGTVVFNTSADAAKAIREYHDRTFDGKPMKLELVVSANASKNTSLASRLGDAPASYLKISLFNQKFEIKAQAEKEEKHEKCSKDWRPIRCRYGHLHEGRCNQSHTISHKSERYRF